MSETTLKRGQIVLGMTRTAITRGMGCQCSGPAYGTPYCPCTLVWMQGQVPDEGDYDDNDYEDRKK
jgi:hypothetical protein